MNFNSKLNNYIPLLLLIFSILTTGFIWGFISSSFKTFPYPQLMSALLGINHIAYELELRTPYFYQAVTPDETTQTDYAEKVQPGLRMLVRVGKEKSLFIDVINQKKELIHSWNPDWFRIWGDAEHLSQFEIPQSRPGTHIHGALVLDNGDLLFNFESLGLVRMDACGGVVWKLPFRTHHSIEYSNDGNFWIPGRINYFDSKHERTGVKGPYYAEDFILKVSPEGKILLKVSLLDILEKNNLLGLMQIGGTSDVDSRATEDILHLNDIEEFPIHLKEGFFTHGDLMLSLRNINTVLVLDSKDFSIKYYKTGSFLRQHDPDFISGNEIAIYDNNNRGNMFKGESKIISINVATNKQETILQGSDDLAFYTNIMGKQQWLENGNLLITESMKGRAFEWNQNDGIIWEYYNRINQTHVGIIEELKVLDSKLDETFFYTIKSQCPSNA